VGNDLANLQILFVYFQESQCLASQLELFYFEPTPGFQHFFIDLFLCYLLIQGYKIIIQFVFKTVTKDLSPYFLLISERQSLLESFTKKPNDFKHMDLIKQMENISLEPKTQE
jgi:hypothetical protein